MKVYKIKSRLKKGGIYNKNFSGNYLTAWIANLGVVPLFLLAAFLLAPAFFFFLSLLLFVTHVLETIRQLLYRYRNNISLLNNFKPYFLPVNSLCVKEIFLSALLTLVLPCAQSSEIPSHDIILSRGQSTEIDLKQMGKFNVGNRQVLTYHLNESTKKLLIRGNQLGYSEILVWNKDKSMESYQVSVISKIQEAKFLHLAEITAQLGLSSQILVPHVRVSGNLTTLSNYLDYKK